MKKILITAALGYFAVLLTGMLFYRFELFNPHKHFFSVTVFGFIGAVMYAVFLYKEKREIIFTAALIFILHFILFKPYRLSYIIRDIIAITAVMGSVGIYVKMFLPMIKKRYKIVRIFALPLVYGIINCLAFLLLLVILNIFFSPLPVPFWDTLLLYFRYGVMIGIGLAIGFNFAEFVVIRQLEERS